MLLSLFVYNNKKKKSILTDFSSLLMLLCTQSCLPRVINRSAYLIGLWIGQFQLGCGVDKVDGCETGRWRQDWQARAASLKGQISWALWPDGLSL